MKQPFEITEMKEVPKIEQLARDFLKQYARTAWLAMVGDHLENQLDIKCRRGSDLHHHSDELLDDVEWLEKKIFGSWQGQTVQAIYYQLQDKKVEMTKGNDLWHQDDVFAKVVEEVLREHPVDFIRTYGMEA